MSLNNWKNEDLEFLKKFYDDGCSMSWDDICERTSPTAQAISNWIENAPEPHKYPLILPSILPNNQSNWVAMAYSASQCEELRDLLNAYIGPSGSDYNGLKYSADPADPVGQVAASWTKGSGYFQFSCDEGQKIAVKKRLETLQNVLKRRPPDRSCVARTTESMLTDFQKALVSHNEHLASIHIEELREGGRLSSENLLFLKFERYATFERWNEIRLDPQWASLLYARRPRKVTSHMIKSIWYTKLAAYAEASDVEGLIDEVRNSVLPNDQVLFRSYPGYQAIESRLTCIAVYVSMTPQRGAQAQEIAEALPSGSDARSLADLLLTKLEPLPVAVNPADDDPLSMVRDSLANDDYDAAWLLLQDAPSGIERCKLLLVCACEKDLPQVAVYVAEALQALSASEQQEVLKARTRQRCWQEIQDALVSEDVSPTDWESWLDIVDENPDSKLVNEWVREAVEMWDVQLYRGDPKRVVNLANNLETSLDGPRGQFLQFALPDIIMFFQPDGEAESVFKPIYSKMLFFLGVSEVMVSSDWYIAESLLTALLSVGLTESEYKDGVEAVSEIWENSGDLQHLYWALDILDLLVTSPVKNQEAFDAFFVSILRSFHKFARRISNDDKIFFELLCKDLCRGDEYNGIPFPQDESAEETEAEEISLHDLFSGKDIGILTLQEGPPRRVEELLKKHCESVRVRISNDHGGTDKLKSIARECDFVVVVTQACKHSAYYYLRDNRPKSKNELILPPGRGANSIIGALKKQALSAHEHVSS